MNTYIASSRGWTPQDTDAIGLVFMYDSKYEQRYLEGKELPFVRQIGVLCNGTPPKKGDDIISYGISSTASEAVIITAVKKLTKNPARYNGAGLYYLLTCKS